MLKDEIARIAFEAYAKQVGGKTYDGKPIPGWNELGDNVRAGWRAAIEAIVKHVAKLVSNKMIETIQELKW